MLIGLFEALRAAKTPVSLREWLDLLAALDADLAFADIERFHALARTVLIKDERHYDRFDRAFGDWLRGVARNEGATLADVPDDWLRQTFQRLLGEEEKARIEALGGLEKLLEEFHKRLAEQRERHAGGNRWIGTGGSSPFGAGGYHPEGIRVGPRGGGRRAVKVWEKRQFRNLDEDAELGPRTLQIALRRLRRFARNGAAEEFDLDGTIDATARDAGLLDIRLRPERRNAVKVLLFLDIGGSMDDHVHACEALFAACRSEFKRLEHYYFHNFVYESVWRDNNRRFSERTPINELLRRYNADHKVVFVGDAAMAPYEITHPGGSIEHWNEEAGQAWFQRIATHFPKLVWINPNARQSWDYTQSTRLVRQLVDERMYPLTIDGLTEAMRTLAK
ncbi:MAG: VWA domain-containing protein [Lysobacteraceae bacterium]